MKNSSVSLFHVGDVVVNFGAIVRVVEIDPVRGLLVRIMRVKNQGGAGQKYYAQADKCQHAPKKAPGEGWAEYLAK